MAASMVDLVRLPETQSELFKVSTICDPDVLCDQDATVAQIVEKFHQTLASRLVLVDRAGQPSGMVILAKLLPYLLTGRSRAVALHQIRPTVIEPVIPVIEPVAASLPQESGPQPLSQDEAQHHQLAARNADLIQLNQLKDEFLACISHELRSPLTAILGLSTLLKDQALGELNDRQLRYAQQIHRSGRHLIGIVNDMLDLTRIETDQVELIFEPVSISSVCMEALEQAQKRQLVDAAPIAEPISPNFTLTIEPGLVMLTVDENRLRQMLTNLLSNALKFTPAGGAIGLKVTRWEGWIAFTVWDTGIGIAPEKQHLIFQKFQQLESPMTRQFEGTGLGLVLTQRLVRLHGGDITFTSQAQSSQSQNGSEFTLLLPPEPPLPQSTTAPIPAPPVSLLSPRLVLVVETNTRNVADITGQLSELGYRTVVARSGTEAVEKARQLQPCAILLNPHLPALSGWDVLTLLKASATTQHIPVVVTAPAAEQEQADMQSADGFLTLPIGHAALRTQLETLSPQAQRRSLERQHYIVLCLSPSVKEDQGDWSIELTHLLHRHNFRMIEAHDLEQAEMLARVWKAQVVVLNAILPEPLAYLTQLSEYPHLSALPLITLDAATTQVANQIPDLAVFPCLANWQQQHLQQVPIGLPDTLAEQFLQAVEIAVSFSGRPFVLATDLAAWTVQDCPERQDWLQALVQYMQAAGLRGGIGRSRGDILETLQTESVSLLLLYWHDNTSVLQRALVTLEQLDPRPPMLLIDHHHAARSIGPALRKSLQALNITVVSPSESMDDLLRQVRQQLGIAG